MAVAVVEPIVRPGALFLSLFLASPAVAAWTAIGPERATLTAVASAADGRLLAGTAQGLVFQLDGDRWSPVATRRSTSAVRQIVPGPGELWLLDDDGLYRDTDLRLAGARDVAVTNAAVYAIVSGRVVKSTDNGATWHALTMGEDIIAISHDAAGTVWALGRSSTVYRSSDGGVHTSSRVPLIDVIADPSRAGVVFAVSEFGAGFRTTNNGETWTEIEFLPSKIAFDGNRLLLVDAIGRVSQSDNDGSTFRILYADVPALSIAADPRRPGTIYAGLRGEGLLVSNDGGETFVQYTRGLAGAAEITSVATSSDDRVIYAGTPTTMFKSEDRGANWHPMFFIRQLRGPFGNVAIDANDSRHVWINAANAVWKSRDNGGNLNHQFDFPSDLVDFAIESVESVFIATERSVVAYTGRDYTYDVRSPPLREGDRIATMFREPTGVLWVGGSRDATGALLFRSADGGVTWTELSSRADGKITALFVRDGVAFAGGERLLRSDDGGQTWRAVAAFGNPVVDIDFIAGMFYAAAGNDVYASPNGSSWQRVLSSDVPVTGLAGNASVLAATNGRGLLRQQDSPTDRRARAVRR
jgi:photosystem II stability/assembly factor-like uncharacterized protein